MSIIVDVRSVIYGLNSHLKCSLKSILEKKHQALPFLYIVHEALIKVPLFQETSPDRKIRGCVSAF